MENSNKTININLQFTKEQYESIKDGWMNFQGELNQEVSLEEYLYNAHCKVKYAMGAA